MPYRRIPGHARDSPLKHWLWEHLPSERPSRVKAQTWDMLHAYVAGTSLMDLETEYGLSAEAIATRFRTMVQKLGYAPPEVQRWLLPDRTVAPHMIDVDRETDCWLWTGTLRADELGPSATLPEDVRPPGSTTAYPRVSVRRFLFKQGRDALPRNQVVVAMCGRRACVRPKRASVRARKVGRSAIFRDELLQRKDAETVPEAAARLGVSVATIRELRGAGGKGTDTSKLRPWLKEHVPVHRPASVIEQDWEFARQYVEGVTLVSLGAEAGVSRQRVHLRVKRMALALGWTDPASSADDNAGSGQGALGAFGACARRASTKQTLRYWHEVCFPVRLTPHPTRMGDARLT